MGGEINLTNSIPLTTIKASTPASGRLSHDRPASGVRSVRWPIDTRSINLQYTVMMNSSPGPEQGVALVTGATGGLGRALVELLALRGYRVIAAARNPDRLPGIAGVTSLRLDVTDRRSIEAAMPALRAVDVVINNAGLNLGDGIAICRDPEAAEREMQVNFFGPLRLARAMVPLMKERGGGAIVNILSLLALAPLPLCGSYSASKAAAHSMTQAMRAELRRWNVRVIGVYPGPIDTAMAADLPEPKEPPSAVALAVVDALDGGQDEVFPGAVAQDLGAMWRANPKALEALFAGTN